MQLSLLIEDRMQPIPDGITLIDDYGYITIVAEYREGIQQVPVALVRGQHAIVEGGEDVLKTWLGPFDGVWVGSSNPILEQFEIMHIK